jgi:hypothetical protein
MLSTKNQPCIPSRHLPIKMHLFRFVIFSMNESIPSTSKEFLSTKPKRNKFSSGTAIN